MSQQGHPFAGSVNIEACRVGRVGLVMVMGNNILPLLGFNAIGVGVNTRLLGATNQ